MKKFFCFCQFFSAYLCIVYIFPSCAATITITGSNPNTGELTLVDSKGNQATVFEVDAGKCIKWKIAKGINVSSIQDLDKKDTSINVFRKLPHKKWLSKSWKGTVEKLEILKEKFAGKETPDGYIVEDYFIGWKANNDSTHVYDPKIQVKSR